MYQRQPNFAIQRLAALFRNWDVWSSILDPDPEYSDLSCGIIIKFL
jgi:hypothetical protein